MQTLRVVLCPLIKTAIYVPTTMKKHKIYEIYSLHKIKMSK